MAFNLLLVLLLLFIIMSKKPMFYQWLLLILMVDPTGHLQRYFNKEILGGIEINDIIFVIIVFSFFIVGNYNIKDYFNNKTASGIFKVLFIFFIYRLIVYGYLVPPVSGPDEYFRYFFIRERGTLFAFLIIIPVYLIALKNLKTYFYIILFLGSLTVTLYVVSIITHVEIIPSDTMIRYHGESVLRQFMYGYNMTFLLISLSIVVYLSKIKIRYKGLLFIGGVFSIIVILISLTKGMYLSMSAVIIASFLISKKLLRIEIRRGITKFIVLAFLVLLTLSIFMPSYMGFSLRLFSDLYYLGTTGTYETGRQEGRMINSVPAQLYMIEQRPLFGTGPYGYKKHNMSKRFYMSDYDATDVTITGTIMQYGILGMFIYYIFYYKLYLVVKRIYTRLKRKNKFELLTEYKYEFLCSVASISFLIGCLARVHNITGELLNNSIIFYTFVGILLACLERINRGIPIETK